MAIRLVPETRKRNIPLTIENMLLYSLVPLAVALTLSLVIVLITQSSVSKKLDKVEASLAEMNMTELREKERLVLDMSQRMQIYNQIIEEHQRDSLFFERVSEFVHERSFVTSISLDARRSKSIVSVHTEEFSDIHEQMLLFKETDFIDTAVLTDAGFSDNGGVDYIVTLHLSPLIFKE